MNEETTTPPAENIQAPDVLDTSAQPNDVQPTEAVQSTEEPSAQNPSPNEPAANPADNSDDDLSDYWSKKGIDISTPEGQVAAAKSYREAEKAMHRKGQEASELSKQLTEAPVIVNSEDELVKQLANEVVTMKRAQSVNEFKESVSLTAEQERKMADYLTENPDKVQLVNGGYMSLKEVYTLSGANAPDAEALKKQGEQAALQELATRQRTTAIQGAASTPTSAIQVTSGNVEEWYAGLSASERADPANQARLSALLK
jgi:hypothetical protein